MGHALTSVSNVSSVCAGGAMTVDEFCQWARIGKTKAYAEANAGRLKFRKFGSKTLVLRSDAEDFLQALPIGPAA